jgi:putative addiction module killer protein
MRLDFGAACISGENIRRGLSQFAIAWKQMLTLRKTRLFDEWLMSLRDLRARFRIVVRLERLAAGNAGQMRSVGGGVSELKIDYGPGYRVYFIRHGGEAIILLCGGDKSSQSRDIELAKRLAQQADEGE